jgi:hypothetical protein
VRVVPNAFPAAVFGLKTPAAHGGRAGSVPLFLPAAAALEQGANPRRPHARNRPVAGKTRIASDGDRRGQSPRARTSRPDYKGQLLALARTRHVRNTIDLCMQVLRLSFNDAMLALSQSNVEHERRAGPNAS